MRTRYEVKDFSAELAAKFCRAFATAGGSPTEMDQMVEISWFIRKALAILRGRAKLVPRIDLNGMELAGVLATSIDDLELPIKVVNSLKHEGIRTLEKLVTGTEDEVLMCRNLGRVGFQVIANVLEELDLNLCMKFEGANETLSVVDWGVPPGMG
jgi:DNA-directed RNA polymerase alpha subunit